MYELMKLCKKFNLDYTKLYLRRKRRWTLEEMLEVITWQDHLGNRYDSLEDMCNKYDIPVESFKRRVHYDDWSLEKMLTYKKDTSISDHNGFVYQSEEELCRAYQININTFRSRLDHGWNLKSALTTPVKSNQRFYVTDHLGNVFHNTDEMCRHWGIKSSLFFDRKRRGWNLKDCLTTPVNYRNIPVTDPITGREYSSFRSLCLEYGLGSKTVMARVEKGMDLATALTTPPRARVFKSTWRNIPK